VLVLTTVIQGRGFCPMCDMMVGWGWAGMLIMGLFWIAIIAAVVWLILRLVRGRGVREGRAGPDVVCPGTMSG
jgi:uncharacterized membrane protein